MLFEHCTITTWKWLISRFVGGGEHKTTNWTSVQSFKIQLQKKMATTHEFIFWVTFSPSSPTQQHTNSFFELRFRRRRRRFGLSSVLRSYDGDGDGNENAKKSNRKVSRSWNNRDITFSSDDAGGFHRRRRRRIFKVMLHETIRDEDF